ncbi:hypothetical protein SeMB42_g04688 [Synchytrium endobioticum]|uniref:CobW/HypB/UreG nucleotide-binding domain-containing protein n=1 Tax=Synchytrium endobioticum TaxID=286115 RepID=A0A507CNM4_9FUNG|nr:hypothetical protein SeLEV6574_g06428 [Synchytrium endobioticum]TPX43545.1 hypothetical protein SeMB42_g04688 [Synchytrium endobioticum]
MMGDKHAKNTTPGPTVRYEVPNITHNKQAPRNAHTHDGVHFHSSHDANAQMYSLGDEPNQWGGGDHGDAAAINTHDGVHFQASHDTAMEIPGRVTSTMTGTASHLYEAASYSHESQSRGHGHTHEQMEHPGLYHERGAPLKTRDWEERAFTVGVAGPVGSGKTALMLYLCQKLYPKYNIGVVTNDIFTKEDAEFLIKHKALPQGRIKAVQTGGCPHAAIREDISANLGALEELQAEFGTQLLLIESGGDNLAANFSRELADYIIYVIDVTGGDKVPRKGGPGITQSDLLLINKTDLAEAMESDLSVMERDANLIRDGGPVIFVQIRNGKNMDQVIQHILTAYNASGAATAALHRDTEHVQS